MTEKNFIDLTDSDFEIARWIWKNLVPKSGQADTVQGEILRAIEKLRWEAQENGNINWDYSFEMFIDFLQNKLGNEERFSKETRAEIANDLARLKNFIPPDELENDLQKADLPYIEDDLYDRLTNHLVSFCRLHPEVIQLQKDERQYR
ncbi:hypothetical protein [Geobacter metallireducens]|nr:hypothetical protein [Geobacter metallireducens]